MKDTDVSIEKLALATAIYAGSSKLLVLESSKDYFSDKDCTRVYSAIQEVSDSNMPVTPMSIKRSCLGFISPEYIDELATYVNPSAMTGAIDTIKEMYLSRERRRIISNANDSMNRGKIPEAVARDMMEELGKLSEIQSGRKIATEGESMRNLYETSMERALAGGALIGIETGYSKLNYYTDGYQPGKLYHIAARPGMGKTALTVNLKRGLSSQGIPGLYFSLETRKEILSAREISGDIEVSVSNILKGQMTPPKWGEFESLVESRRDAKFFIDDSNFITVEDMRDRIRRAKHEHGIQYVMIDYLQIMDTEVRGNTREKIKHISKSIKRMADDFEIFFIILNQVSRKAEDRPGSVPMISDISEASTIEADADLVMLIYRPEYYNIETDEFGNLYPFGFTRIIIAKNNDGPTGDWLLGFSAKTMTYEELPMDWMVPKIPKIPEVDATSIEGNTEEKVPF